MAYRLIARDRVFCEGTLAECQKTLTGISHMISAGLSTNFHVEEFLIVDSEVMDIAKKGIMEYDEALRALGE